ncbi:Thymidylate synthase [Phlyctochytrium planicorne]|nr:Thymidylate synthase [Phlyctochytrium planicorne]
MLSPLHPSSADDTASTNQAPSSVVKKPWDEQASDDAQDQSFSVPPSQQPWSAKKGEFPFPSPYANTQIPIQQGSETSSAFNTSLSVPSLMHEENQYLSMIHTILQFGEKRKERTGTGTLSLFAPPTMRFDLRDNKFPLFTTKRVPLRAVFEELMWFIKGSTDANLLTAKNVHIWDANGSRDALDAVGLSDYRDGELGPVYGFQWRHFGAEYQGPEADYDGKGVDQIKEVIRKIKETPTDRRILLSAWNPSDLDKMALPPCHLLSQFYVSYPENQGIDAQPDPSKKPRGVLSCQLYQRSADMGLGVPFNVASYSLLTILLAHVTGLEAGSLTVCLGDAHVYLDHVDALKVQLERTPKPFPSLKVLDTAGREEREGWGVEKALEELEGVVFGRLLVEGYEPHAKIQMKMSV